LKEYQLFAQKIGILGIVNILTTLSGIILLPILTKNLSIVDYGIWVQVTVTLMLVPGVISFGLPNAMIRFLAAEKNNEVIKEGFYSIFFFVVFVSLLVSIFIFLFSNIIAYSIFGGYVYIAEILAVVTFMATLNALIINYFLTFQQIRRFSVFTFLQSYLMLILVSVFVIWGYGIYYAVIGLFISQIMIFVVMMLLIVREIGFKFPKFISLREYLSYGIPSLPISLSNWTVSSSDRYIIALFMGMAYVGYYSPAYSIGSLLFILIAPFSLLLMPVLTEKYDTGKLDEVKNFLRYSQRYYLLLVIPSFFGLAILAKPILLILTTAAIAAQGYIVVPIVALGILLSGIGDNYRQILLLKKKTPIIGYIWIFAAIINLILNILLVPVIGIVGAAITTLIGYGILFTLTFYYSRRYIRFNPDTIYIIKSVVASIIMGVVLIFLMPKNFIGLVITIIVGAVTYLTVLALIKGIDKQEIKFILKMFQIG
jgi:O-antigen/teichoic acid export membrane protein